MDTTALPRPTAVETRGEGLTARLGDVVPRRCTLDGFMDEVSRADGIHLADVEPLATLFVRTENSVYQITVVQPQHRHVLVQGGRFFPQPTRASLSGSTFGGSCLKLAWVGIGFRMEFHYAGEWIVTSRVRSIQVGREAQLPGPF